MTINTWKFRTDEALHVMDYPIPGEKGTVLSVYDSSGKNGFVAYTAGNIAAISALWRGGRGGLFQLPTPCITYAWKGVSAIKVQYENTERYAGDKFTWGDSVCFGRRARLCQSCRPINLRSMMRNSLLRSKWGVGFGDWWSRTHGYAVDADDSVLYLLNVSVSEMVQGGGLFADLPRWRLAF